MLKWCGEGDFSKDDTDMLTEYRKQRNIALGLIVLASLVWIPIVILFESEWAVVVGQAFRVGAGFLFFVMYYYYAKAKGYHGAWGLLGFSGPLGWVILMCFPDRHKTTKKTPV